MMTQIRADSAKGKSQTMSAMSQPARVPRKTKVRKSG